MHDAHVLMWHIYAVHGGAMVATHPAYNDDRNCTVRAIEKALGLHRITAYVEMAEQGRKHGRGVMPALTKQAYRNIAGKYGFTYTKLDRRDAHRDYGKTIVSAQRALARHERVIFNVRGHVIGFANCETNDWAEGRRHHITSVHKFRQAA